MNANQVIVYHNDPVVAVHVHILYRDLNEVLRPRHHVQAARVQLTLRPAQYTPIQLLRNKSSSFAQSSKLQLLHNKN